MGDKAVIVSWHNGSPSEPMRNATSDTMTQWFGITGYPGCIVHRVWNTGGVGAYRPPGSNPFEVVTELVAGSPTSQYPMFGIGKEEPLVDFRIVNASYNAATRELDFDLDMTPLMKNVGLLPKFDTAKYQSVAIITEDGLVYDQVNYGYGGLDNPIEGFIHYNVGRKAIGKVLGDDFPYSATATTLPARKHYSYTVPQAWDHSKIKVKVFVAARHPKTGTPSYAGTKILNAAQTPYLTTLPATVANSVYMLTPNGGGLQPAGPIKLVWGKGGSVDMVKLEYSDNGTATWNTIETNLATTSLDWVPPASATGKQVVVRASWVTNGAVNSTSGQFSFTAPPAGSITITKPANNEELVGGAKNYAITWTKTGTISAAKTIEFSPDMGVTWEPVGSPNDDNLTFAWNVPNVASSGALVRISSENDVTDVSDPFKIALSYIFISEPHNAEEVQANTEKDIIFGKSLKGITTNKTIEYTTNGGTSWTEITKLTTDITTYKWMVPDIEANEVMVRIVDANGIIGESSVFKIVKTIAPKPGFKTFTIDPVTNNNIPFNTKTYFSWTFQNGSVPGNYTIQMSTDNKASWDAIVNDVPHGTNQAEWTTPSDEAIPAAFFRITTGNFDDPNETITTAQAISIGAGSGVKNNGGTPTAFRLSTNYPNPFASVTNMNFDVPERSFVTLVVRNELGQEVARLVSGLLDAGSYTADFDATKLPVGFYTYTLESGSTKLTGKMSVVR
jgi:hypothetical protein